MRREELKLPPATAPRIRTDNHGASAFSTVDSSKRLLMTTFFPLRASFPERTLGGRTTAYLTGG
jgi:hypothetical protein